MNPYVKMNVKKAIELFEQIIKSNRSWGSEVNSNEYDNYIIVDNDQHISARITKTPKDFSISVYIGEYEYLTEGRIYKITEVEFIVLKKLFYERYQNIENLYKKL